MPTDSRRILALALLGALTLGACSKADPEVSFAAEVQPLLTARCGGCHRPGQAGHAASGLSMESYAALMKGTRFGAVVIPGDALSSALTMLIEGRADPSIRMPHGGSPLTMDEQRLVHRWVLQGAKDN